MAVYYNDSDVTSVNSTPCFFQIEHSAQKDPSNCSVFKQLIDIYVVFFLCLVGIIGNVLSIVVLGRDKTMHRTTAFLLQMVAVADVFYLTACLFFQTANTVLLCTNWFHLLDKIWPLVEPYIWPFASIAQTCTVWLVVVVTADRYIAICRPLHAAHYITISRMRKVVLFVFVFAVVYNMPRFFERQVQSVFNHCKNETTFRVNRTALREDKIYIVTYKTGLFFLLRFFLPLSMIAFTNTKLIQAIKRSSSLRRDGGRTNKRNWERRQHTLILVVIVLVFVFCGMPDFILRVWLSICGFANITPGTHQQLWIKMRDVNTFSNLCLTINSCINFVIYCLLGRKFRIILVRMVCNKREGYEQVRQGVTLKSFEKQGAANQATCNLLAHAPDSSTAEELYA